MRKSRAMPSARCSLPGATVVCDSAIARLLVLNDTSDLLDGGKTRLDLAPSIGPQRHEAVFRGQRAQVGARCARRDRVAEVIGDEQQLEHTKPASKSRAAARRTADTARQSRSTYRTSSDHRHRLRAWFIGFPAVLAYAPYKPLREHAFERCSHEVVGNSQIEKSRDGADRIVRVQRAEDETPRHCRLHRNLCGFLITHLAD